LYGICSIKKSILKKIEDISFLQISNIPQLIKDFLNHELTDFNDAVFDLQKVAGKITSKQKFFTPEKRKLLYDVLLEQHSQGDISVNQHINLNALLADNTFTITTGHQLNLFTGPVFFIYKILQTIKLSEFLKKNFPESNFVPIFWMATEDHDFEEINHFKTDHDFFEIKAKSGGAVGRIEVEDQYFIHEFENAFKDSVYGTELILLMKKAYKKQNTFSQATRILVQQLFSEYGVLIIDGDHSKLKSQMKEVFRKELLHQQLFSSSKKNIDFLKGKYGKVQVNPREINLFYLSETRNRIEKIGNEFHIVDTSTKFSESEILDKLENHPENFSPNAVLRPVYQESVLPNIAYVGGNAEIMYWLELKDYFDSVEVPFPFLIPRSSMLMISEKNLSKIEKLGLTIHDFLKDFASLSKDFVLDKSEVLDSILQKEKILENQFTELIQKAKRTDKTFENLVQAEEKRQMKSFERMKKRLLRAEKIKQNEKLERLENLFIHIHPSGIWQERVYNFSVFYSEMGKEWLQNCYQEMDASNSALIIFKF